MRVPILEVEQINLIMNNSNPYLRTWLSLTGMPVTFAELYSRGRSIQIQLRDPSFQLYLPRPKKKEPVSTTEGTTSNEQVTMMSTYSRPTQSAQRSSQPPRLPNQPAVPEAFRPQANAGPSQAHCHNYKFRLHHLSLKFNLPRRSLSTTMFRHWAITLLNAQLARSGNLTLHCLNLSETSSKFSWPTTPFVFQKRENLSQHMSIRPNTAHSTAD